MPCTKPLRKRFSWRHCCKTSACWRSIRPFRICIATAKNCSAITSLAEHEKKRVQADHAAVGGWLMRTWNLPERLYRAIEHSHRLELSYSAHPAGVFDRCVALSGPVADLRSE